MEERIFYKPAMKSGASFQIFMPKDIAVALGIEDRDELELRIRKTGKKIPKTTRFIKREAAVTEEGVEENEVTGNSE